MKNDIGTVGGVITLPAPHNLKSGDLVVVGLLSGVALRDAPSGDPVDIVPGGSFSLKKKAGTAWTQGAAIYANPANGVCDVTATAGHLFVGAALEAARSDDTVGDVYLNGVAPAALVPSAGG